MDDYITGGDHTKFQTPRAYTICNRNSADPYMYWSIEGWQGLKYSLSLLNFHAKMTWSDCFFFHEKVQIILNNCVIFCLKLPNSAKVCYFANKVECLEVRGQQPLSQSPYIVNILLPYANLVYLWKAEARTFPLVVFVSSFLIR